MDELMAQKNFEQFAWRMEGLPTFDLPQVHGGGHFGVGGVKGQMGDAFGSPGGKQSTFFCVVEDILMKPY